MKGSSSLFAALLLLACGAVPLLHGLGLISARALNPNPDVPEWVFTLIGIVLIAAGGLVLMQSRGTYERATHATGALIFTLMMVLSHWLVFFSGATCSLSVPFITIGGGGMCAWTGRAVLLFIDVVLLMAVWSEAKRMFKT